MTRRIVKKTYTGKPVWHIVADQYDPIAKEYYETTICRFDTEEEAIADQEAYYKLTDEIPF